MSLRFSLGAKLSPLGGWRWRGGCFAPPPPPPPEKQGASLLNLLRNSRPSLTCKLSALVTVQNKRVAVVHKNFEARSKHLNNHLSHCFSGEGKRRAADKLFSSPIIKKSKNPNSIRNPINVRSDICKVTAHHEISRVNIKELRSPSPFGGGASHQPFGLLRRGEERSS